MAKQPAVPADLTSFVPRIVPEWIAEAPEARHRAIPGTLVFTDLSGFTAMSERLAALGKVGAEQMTHHLDATFTELVAVSGGLGGTMLKFGGDALLIFFWGDEHHARAAKAALDMQSTLDRIGLISTTAGDIRLRMTVGAHCGDVDFFLVGSSHRELFVCGSATSKTVDVEGRAESGEVRVSRELAASLGPGVVDATEDPALLTTAPEVGPQYTSWPVWPEGVGPNRFVPEMLRNHLSSGVELREHRQMVIGFIHLANVDALIVDVGADATATHLGDLVAHIQKVFATHGVAFISTDVYTGGPKIICASGAVRTFGNDDESLLRALREVVDYPSPIELRIGVNRGHGFCGYVGPPFRRTFVTIGDVVNTAARVMSKAGPGEILSTSPVIDRSETLFELTELDAFVAKGKAEPVIAYRVGEVLGSREQSQGSTPFVGREEELGHVVAALEDARARRGRFVEIRGDAGMGKSRLLTELVSRSQNVLVCEERCGRYAASTPYFPFRNLLASLVGGRSLEALSEKVHVLAPELEPYLPLLALPLSLVAEPTADVERLSAKERRTKLHEVFIEFLSVLVSVPTIWVLEDAHWIDEASAGLLRHLATRVELFPLLLCVTHRPDGGESFGRAEDLLELRELSQDAAEKLLEEAATRHLLPKELTTLAARAHGNPYFLVELAAATSAQRDFEHLPDSLEAMIAARIDALPPADRLVLRQLAVVGSRFDPRTASEAVESLPPPRDKRWRNLDDFIDRSAEPWRFRQTLVRDTAYEGLSYRERREVHARAGASIEQHTSDAAMLCELLSLHFHAAGSHAKALQYSNEAAEKAQQSYSFAEAATFFGRSAEAARGLGDDVALGDALTGLGHAERDQGHYDSARESYAESLSIKRALGNTQGVAAQLSGLGMVARAVGAYEQAYEFFEESLATLRTLSQPENLGTAMTHLGAVAWHQGDYDKAQAWFEEGLAAQRHDNDRSGEADSLGSLGAIAYVQGDLAGARQRFEARLEIARELGDRRGIASGLLNLGNLAVQEGRMDAAWAHFDGSLELQRELGSRQGVANALLNLGMVAHLKENYQVARENYEASLGILRELGDRHTASQCLHNLGEAALAEGDRVEGQRYCEESLAIRREIGDRRGIAEDLTTLGTVASDAADYDKANRLLLEALDLHFQLGNKLGLAECLETVAAATVGTSDGLHSAKLLGAVDGLLASTGSARTWSAERRNILNDNLRAKVSDSVFEKMLGIGGAMSMEEALELARSLLGREPIETASA